MAATVLSVATNQGFLRDPLDVRLADASAVTLILTAWLVGGFWPALAVPGAEVRARAARPVGAVRGRRHGHPHRRHGRGRNADERRRTWQPAPRPGKNRGR